MTDHTQPFLDALEPRQLLASDLVAGLNLSQVSEFLVPGSRINITLTVDNAGVDRATGTVDIAFYLSADTLLDANDALLSAFPGEAVDLGGGDSGDFFAPTEVPRNLANRRYFIIGRITPVSGINDAVLTNNTTVSSNSVDVSNRFGVVGDRQREILRLRDTDGTDVNFDIGANGGTGTVEVVNGRFRISITGTGSSSDVVITTSGSDNTVDLDSVTSAASLRSFTASTARLTSNFSVTGTIATLILGAATGPGTITITGTGVTASLSLGPVTNFNITSSSPISLAVSSWTDTDPTVTPDLIRAPRITTLTSVGNFNASLNIAGDGTQPAVSSIAITGVVTGGSWRVVGNVGSASVAATLAPFSASVTGKLNALSVTRILRGVITARNFGTITVGIDIDRARIIAGANLGDDARLGGIGASADTFLNGNFTGAITVTRRIIAAVIGAGLDPVDGVFNNGDDRIINGRIASVVAGSTVAPGTRFYAASYGRPLRFNNINIVPTVDPRFVFRDLVAPTVTLVGRVVLGTQTFVQIQISDNRAILRSSVASGALRLVGPSDFTIIPTVSTISGTGNANFFTVQFLVADSNTDTFNSGTYSVFLEAGTIRDTSQRLALAGLLGTIEVED